MTLLPLDKSGKKCEIHRRHRPASRHRRRIWTCGAASARAQDPPVTVLAGNQRQGRRCDPRRTTRTARTSTASFPSLFEDIPIMKLKEQPTAHRRKKSTKSIDEAVAAAQTHDVVVMRARRNRLHERRSRLAGVAEISPAASKRCSKPSPPPASPSCWCSSTAARSTSLGPPNTFPRFSKPGIPAAEGGNAIADVLFGDANPGGTAARQLAAQSPGKLPLYYNHNLTHDPEDRSRLQIALLGCSEHAALPLRLRPQLHQLQVRQSDS